MAELVKPEKGLWLAVPRQIAGQAVKSVGTYRRTKHLNIMCQADGDRRARHAVLGFPDAGVCYIVEDATQLKAIIDKLQVIYDHIVGKGQSRIVSFTERKDWE